MVVMQEKKPFVAVVVIQSIYAGHYLLTKLAFDVGMNTFIFVFYRQAFATFLLVPCAIFFQWKTAPRLSFCTFIKINMLTLFGITMNLDLAGVGLKYTSASLGAAASNTLPVMTFMLAVLLRMEKLDVRTRPGMMKAAGVCICTGGVASIAFYRGPSLKLYDHYLINALPSSLHGNAAATTPARATWIKGVILMWLSVLSWSCWIVLQGRMLKIYPSKLWLTAWQCFLSTIQTLAVALAFSRDHSQWKLGWNIQLLSLVYCGIVVTGVTFYLQAWVIEKKGPVFLAMTTPLVLVFTVVLSGFVLGEVITLGSVLGAMLLVVGLYFVLWGKTREEHTALNDQCQPCEDDGDAEKGSSVNPTQAIVP